MIYTHTFFFHNPFKTITRTFNITEFLSELNFKIISTFQGTGMRERKTFPNQVCAQKAWECSQVDYTEDSGHARGLGSGSFSNTSVGFAKYTAVHLLRKERLGKKGGMLLCDAIWLSEHGATPRKQSTGYFSIHTLTLSLPQALKGEKLIFKKIF